MKTTTEKVKFTVCAENFAKIPGNPIAYWASQQVFHLFDSLPNINSVGLTRLGMTTGENARFVRFWYEVKAVNCYFSCIDPTIVGNDGEYWIPYNKGGAFRKWYGNYDVVVDWRDDGYKIKHFADESGRIRSTVPNTEYYCRPCATWSKVSSGRIAFRFREHSIFDVAGACYFAQDVGLMYIIGLLNSCVVSSILGILAPTLNFEGGQIGTLPVQIKCEKAVETIVRENIEKATKDWDAFETSWDFKKHPLI